MKERWNWTKGHPPTCTCAVCQEKRLGKQPRYPVEGPGKPHPADCECAVCTLLKVSYKQESQEPASSPPEMELSSKQVVHDPVVHEQKSEKSPSKPTSQTETRDRDQGRLVQKSKEAPLLNRRNSSTPFLVIAALVIATVAFAYLLWQKENALSGAMDQVTELQKNVADMEAQSVNMQKTLAATQGQLTEAQRNSKTLQDQLFDSEQKLQVAQGQLTESAKQVGDLQTQLDDANQQMDALKQELAELKAPPLTAGDLVTVKGDLGPFGLASIPIEIRAFEQVQGEFIAGAWDMAVKIQDPTGVNVQDFGKIRQSNFRFTAQTDGRYVIVIQNPYSNASISYTLQYTVYHK